MEQQTGGKVRGVKNRNIKIAQPNPPAPGNKNLNVPPGKHDKRGRSLLVPPRPPDNNNKNTQAIVHARYPREYTPRESSSSKNGTQDKNNTRRATQARRRVGRLGRERYEVHTRNTSCDVRANRR